MEPNEAIKAALAMDFDELNAWYAENVGYCPSDEEKDLPLHNLRMYVAEMMFYHANTEDQNRNEERWKEATGRASTNVNALLKEVTLTPWKPKQGQPVLLKVPQTFSDADVTWLANMFLGGDVEEVRWQYGHVKNDEYDGNGHYVLL